MCFEDKFLIWFKAVFLKGPSADFRLTKGASIDSLTQSVYKEIFSVGGGDNNGFGFLHSKMRKSEGCGLRVVTNIFANLVGNENLFKNGV